MILYVGIEEKGAIHLDLREPPDGDLRLPEEKTRTLARAIYGEHWAVCCRWDVSPRLESKSIMRAS